MTIRERWIVYPLLLLLLGLAMREKVLRTVHEEIICKRLIVVEERDPATGLIRLVDIGGESTGGVLELFSSQGELIYQLRAGD